MITKTLLSLLTLLNSANAQDYCSKRSAAEDKCDVEPTTDPEARLQTIDTTNLCVHIDFETAGEIEQWFEDAYDWLWNMESCRG